MDGDTRPTHRRLDGQIRETNQPFEMDGKEAMYPGDFGLAEEDCNCRCVALTRARAALDEDELKILRERAVRHSLYMDDPKEYRGEKLPQLKNYNSFKKNYLKAAETLENTGKSGIIEREENAVGVRRKSDGKIVKTTTIDVSPTRAKFKDWEFDWTAPARNGFTVRALKVDGDNRIQGMIAFKPDPANYAVVIDIVESAPFNNPHNKLNKGKEYDKIGVHLFAEAVKESYKQGFNGFVYFQAKTNLVEYYERELDAVMINPRNRIMAITEKVAKEKYGQYFEE